MARAVDRPPPVHAALGEVLDWLILGAILALLAWTVHEGLTFMPSAGFLQSRGPLLAFEQGALVIGAGSLLRWLLGGRALPGAVLGGLGTVLALCLLSLAHTTDLYATREEVFFLVSTTVLVLSAAISLGDARKTYACVIGLVLITLGEAAVGLGQWASREPTPAYWLSRAFAGIIQTRIYGTLGTPNVLAGFLLLGIAATTLLTISLPGLWRLLPAPVLVSEVAALLLTFSRGGYMGLGVFALASGVLLWPVRRRAWPAFVLILLVAGTVAFELPQVTRRVQSIGPAQEDTATSRLFIWRTALRMWDAYRIWGTGLGAFNAAYSSYRPQGVLATYAMIDIPGSAHDDYLQLLAETGVVGGVFVAAAVLWGLWQAKRRYGRGGEEERVWLGTWGAAVAGIGATSLADENLFVVTNVVTLLLLSTATAAHVSVDRPPLRFWQRLLALPLAAVLVGLPPLVASPVRATALHDQATREVKAKRYGDAVDTFRAALVVDPLNAAVPTYLADLLADLYLRRINTSVGPWPTLRDHAEELYLRAVRLNPWDAYPWAALGRLRRFEGRYPEAAEALRQAVERDPYAPRYRVWLGDTLAAEGHRVEAIRQLREAARLYPVELLVIVHHEDRGARYAAAQAQMAEVQRLLGKLEGQPP